MHNKCLVFLHFETRIWHNFLVVEYAVKGLRNREKNPYMWNKHSVNWNDPQIVFDLEMRSQRSPVRSLLSTALIFGVIIDINANVIHRGSLNVDGSH